MGEPAGGNKTGGPAGSEKPALSPQLHDPLSALGFSSMGLQDPLDDGGGVRPWVTASEYLSSWWQHLYIYQMYFTLAV